MNTTLIDKLNDAKEEAVAHQEFDLAMRLRELVTELRSRHPEAKCDDCGRPNVVWFAPNEIWNKVIRPNGEVETDPMLCPTCFIRRAETSGIEATAWKVEPEQD